MLDSVDARFNSFLKTRSSGSDFCWEATFVGGTLDFFEVVVRVGTSVEAARLVVVRLCGSCPFRVANDRLVGIVFDRSGRCARAIGSLL